jgi:hypothetical protein
VVNFATVIPDVDLRAVGHYCPFAVAEMHHPISHLELSLFSTTSVVEVIEPSVTMCRR